MTEQISIEERYAAYLLSNQVQTRWSQNKITLPSMTAADHDRGVMARMLALHKSIAEARVELAECLRRPTADLALQEERTNNLNEKIDTETREQQFLRTQNPAFAMVIDAYYSELELADLNAEAQRAANALKKFIDRTEVLKQELASSTKTLAELQKDCADSMTKLHKRRRECGKSEVPEEVPSADTSCEYE